MPVFTSGKHQAPSWCEMEQFEFIELQPGESRQLSREGAKEEILVCSGAVTAVSGGVSCPLGEGQKMDINTSEQPGYQLTTPDWCSATIFRATGRWNSITSSGIFSVRTMTPPADDTPYHYEKTTGFDNHYHDCDEYWIFFEGRCRVVSEGKFYDVGPGDCLATGMGWHHDVERVLGDIEPVRAIWFEGTLEGAKRRGHLWEPAHGSAVPAADRI